MVILEITESEPRFNHRDLTMHTCTGTRDGVKIMTIHHRKRDLLGGVVRHTLRVMGLGFPVMQSDGTWIIREPGDG